MHMGDWPVGRQWRPGLSDKEALAGMTSSLQAENFLQMMETCSQSLGFQLGKVGSWVPKEGGHGLGLRHLLDPS